MGRTIDIRGDVYYGRRVTVGVPDQVDDPAAAAEAHVTEQGRRTRERSGIALPERDRRRARMEFIEAIAVGVTERIARGIRERHGAHVRVTFNGEDVERVRARLGPERVRLRPASERADDGKRLRFVRRATKMLARVTSSFRPEAVLALTTFRRLVEQEKRLLTRADMLNLQDAFNEARRVFEEIHGPLTVEEMRQAEEGLPA